MARKLSLPLDIDEVKSLRAGEEVLLSGPALTMRDASLKRLEALLEDGEEPPVDISGELIFHAGPTPPAGDRPCGAIGPTTTARMDRFLRQMLELGVAAGITDEGYSGTVIGLLGDYGFSTTFGEREIQTDRILSAMKRDKKRMAGAVRFVIQKDFGQTDIREFDMTEVRKVLR